MTHYWHRDFINQLDIDKVKTVVEIGARYGTESIQLSKIFSKATIHSFECNPLTVNKAKQNVSHYNRICFHEFGLGDKNETKPFYSYVKGNDGASSFYKRIDFNKTQKKTGDIIIKKLSDVMVKLNIKHIDLLCMDIQGYELNVLKGAEKFISNISFIIMEEPKQIINTKYLPSGVHSKYIGAPNSEEIHNYMITNNFREIVRLQENKIEDNVMYKNIT